jgi:hypothetical protein
MRGTYSMGHLREKTFTDSKDPQSLMKPGNILEWTVRNNILKHEIPPLLTFTDRAGVISYEVGLAIGLKPSLVQRAAKYDGGFLVNVEGMHHLHCLVGRFSCSNNLKN